MVLLKRPSLAVVLAVLLAALPAGPGLAHDFYHDEYWGYWDHDGHDHGHGHHRGHVAASKLDMAWELYEVGRHLANAHSLEQAVKPIRQAIELSPKIGRFHLTLGLILRDQGKKDDAIAELRLGKKYGFGWVEEEAYWTLKDLGADPRTHEGDGGGGGGGGSETRAAGSGERLLYDRLGGEDAIRAVIDEFVGRVAADPKVNSLFTKTDIPLFKKRLVQQLGQATGGPQVYEGKDMKTVHEGLKISDAQFDSVVSDLVGAMNKLGVAKKEQDEVLQILGPMRKDIVEVRSGS
jgi:hemoglobin